MSDPTLEAIMTALGYVFRDPTLLQRALTHRSHASERGALEESQSLSGPDNERLEFLGDAVLGLVIAEDLWARAPNAREGELSRVRAAVVNKASLAEVAATLRLGDGLRLGRGEHRTGGRSRPSMLADALEAVIAAVYLDGGHEAARTVLGRVMAPRIEEVLTRGVKDDKSALQEMLQARHKITPTYSVLAITGPDHDRRYEVEVVAGNVIAASGRGGSKKEAAQAAAQIAVQALQAIESNVELPTGARIPRAAEDAKLDGAEPEQGDKNT